MCESSVYARVHYNIYLRAPGANQLAISAHEIGDNVVINESLVHCIKMKYVRRLKRAKKIAKSKQNGKKFKWAEKYSSYSSHEANLLT